MNAITAILIAIGMCGSFCLGAVCYKKALLMYIHGEFDRIEEMLKEEKERVERSKQFKDQVRKEE